MATVDEKSAPVDVELRTKAAELASGIWYLENGQPYLEMVDQIFRYLKYGELPK
jgi:hypothetical protein